MLHVFVMTTRARARTVVVRQVAVGALRVSRWYKHGLIAMACRAGSDFDAAKSMRRVTTGARDMARGQRALVDVQLRALLRVTSFAAGIRRAIGFVHAMAIEAPAQAGVFGCLASVTACARLGIERRRLVRAMAVAAR